ncbi:response regulator [Granulicella sp. 5B5]|uniref:response regulator n=1 Tax=Granulicella sp. 5B5 TaxID=1617967 RepID=UPI0015F690B8|nr:response regulator [Granulicella sp. 5B5]QMV18404.1 response regulator [Granulicella sp. 5B5]
MANVLIVDDDSLVRESLSALLIESGYQVRSVEEGFSALAEAQTNTPDVLLSDLRMPGMSGEELIREVRHRFPTVKVIAMSGSYSGIEVPVGVAAHFFYEKGTDRRSLLRLLKTCTEPTPTHLM